MSNEAFLAVFGAVMGGNLAFGAFAYGLFVMYWTEKKTGTKNWPIWVNFAVVIPPLCGAAAIFLTVR